jgi:hypothetical protein
MHILAHLTIESVNFRRTAGSLMCLAAFKLAEVVRLFVSILRSDTMFFMKPYIWKPKGLRSGDRGGQFCLQPRPIHRSVNLSFRCCVNSDQSIPVLSSRLPPGFLSDPFPSLLHITCNFSRAITEIWTLTKSSCVASGHRDCCKSIL